MSKIKLIFITSLIILLLSGCGRENVIQHNKQVSKPVKIGAILPLTGKAVQYGQDSKQGVLLALEKIGNQNLEVVFEDSLGDAAESISAYQRLTNNQNIKIFISTLSNVSLAIAPLIQNDKNILLVIGSASPSIAKTGNYVFKNNVNVGDEARLMSELVYNKLGIKKVAIYGVNSDAGQNYTQIFKANFSGLGGEIVFAENFNRDELDYKTSLTKIKSLSPEAIYLFERTNGVANILKQIKGLSINSQVLTITGVISVELRELVDDKILEGIIYTDSDYDPAKNSGLEYFGALAYDNLMMLWWVIQNCENPEDTNCIRDGLANIEYNGLTGKTTFDENGDANKPIVFKTIKNSEFVLYE